MVNSSSPLIQKTWLLGFILLIKSSVYGQNSFPPPVHPYKIKVARTHGKIIIDGNLDEKDWQEARIIGDFVQVEPHQGAKPRFGSEIKILFDSTNLYIGAYLHDSIHSAHDIRVQDLSRDFEFQNGDIFGVRIDAFNGKRNCLGFDTNPYGVQRDIQVFDSQVFELNWNALWKVKTRRDEKGWYAEFAIPFSSIRYPKNREASSNIWGMTFIRLKRNINETSTFPPLPRSVPFTRMTYAAEVSGLEVPSPKANIQVQPYASFVDDQSNIQDTARHTSKPKIGLDVKYALNTHTQIDLTINPDFAQADIDQPIINLGRSAISLPEKRQFFLDNSGLFSVGVVGTVFRNTFLQPFFSRSIGLNAEGVPLAIKGGIRFVDRTPKRTIGAMYLRQAGSDSIRATDFSVARVQKNYGEENNLGILLTNKYEEPIHAISQHTDNTSISLSGLNRINNNLALTYLLSGTWDHLFSSTSPKNSQTKGYAGSLSFNYQTNNIDISTEHHLVTQSYNPALGFYARQGTLYNTLSIEPKFRSKKFPKTFREVSPGLFLDIYNDLQTLKIQEVDFGINPISINFVDGTNVFFLSNFTYQNLTDTFTPLHLKIAPGQYKYWQHLMEFRSDQSKPFSFRIFGQIGNFYNAFNLETNLNVRYSPDPHYVFYLDYERNSFKHLGTDSQDIITQVLVSGTSLYYSPKLFMDGLIQYNSLDKAFSYNTKLSWEYSPLSFIYLVLTNLKDEYNRYQERQIISKISFVKQF